MAFKAELIKQFEAHSNAEYAFQMKTYLRDKFELYGIKTKLRRDLLRKVVNDNKEKVSANIRTISKELFLNKHREMHHCGVELYEKFLRKKYLKNDINQIEFFITTNSWWDTVDFIAKQILGAYLKLFPEERKSVISKYSKSKNIWLNRSAILFQLGYKEHTDETLFYNLCLEHRHSDEFFIQKAIGWALREYGKTNPDSVLNFVRSNTLKPLSEKEAIRNII